VVCGSDAEAARKVGLDAFAYMKGCDAYNFFKKLEEAKYGMTNILHLRDGISGTNVADLTIVLVAK